MIKYIFWAMMLIGVAALFTPKAEACPPELRQNFRSVQYYSVPVEVRAVRYYVVEPEIRQEILEEEVCEEPQPQRQEYRREQREVRNFRAYREYCDNTFEQNVQQFRLNVNAGNAYSYRRDFSQNSRQLNFGGDNRQPIFNGQIRERLRNIVSLPFRVAQNFSQRQQELRFQRQRSRERFRQNLNNSGGNGYSSVREFQEFRSY